MVGVANIEYYIHSAVKIQFLVPAINFGHYGKASL